MRGRSVARLYGGSIAIVSGIYSVYLSMYGVMMPGMSRPFMLLLGALVLAHGVALLTPLHNRVRRVSGPLMVLWGLLMAGMQLWTYASTTNLFMVEEGMIAVGAIMVMSGAVMWRYGMAGATGM